MALNLPKVFAGVNDAMRMPTGWANDEDTISENLESLEQIQQQVAQSQAQEQQAKAQGQELDNAAKAQEMNQELMYE
jgi:hypothetical protein